MKPCRSADATHAAEGFGPLGICSTLGRSVAEPCRPEEHGCAVERVLVIRGPRCWWPAAMTDRGTCRPPVWLSGGRPSRPDVSEPSGLSLHGYRRRERPARPKGSAATRVYTERTLRERGLASGLYARATTTARHPPRGANLHLRMSASHTNARRARGRESMCEGPHSDAAARGYRRITPPEPELARLRSGRAARQRGARAAGTGRDAGAAARRPGL